MYGNTLWTDFDRAFFRPLRKLGLPDLLREFERAGFERKGNDNAFAMRDTGDALELLALLPGITEDDVELSVHNDALSLRATRRLDVPGEPAKDGDAGGTETDASNVRVHRSERRAWSLQRTFSLPVQVDAERTKATLRDGVLRVTLAKAEAERPRKIAVTAV